MTADKATTKSVSFDGDQQQQQQQQQPNTDAAAMFDPASLLPTTTKSSTPQPNRDATKAALHALLFETLRPTPCNVYGPGPLLVSDVPKSSLPPTSSNNADNNNNNGGGGGVIMGIDEAGRGPALGPMTYAAAYWHPTNVPTTSIPSDFNDSKQLSSEKRKSLFTQIQNHTDIGFVLRILHASEISRNMLRSPSPYNLNTMSHDAAISMIYAVLNSGVQIDTCYIDTVGIASAYQSKLERIFDGYNINFVVEKKADAKYAPCSAASVVAKESRDAIVEHWKWTESSSSISSGGGGQQYTPVNGHEFGSGYPSDPKCVEWMKSNCNMDKPFGYPDFVRFSWGPTKKSLGEGDTTASGAAAAGGGGERGLIVKWEADEDNEDENGGKQQSMQSFVVKKKVEGNGNNNHGAAVCPPQRKKARLAIFNELGVSKVVAFA